MINKSSGYTQTEKLLAELCENTFLKLWSYPNPYTNNHKEICDLLVVFENDIYIFFDRAKELKPLSSEDDLIFWERWKRTVIDKQIASCYGAERYLLTGKDIYLDRSNTMPFPLKYDKDKVKIHRIIIAHGAEYACKKISDNNINGSLAISYGDNAISDRPFSISLNKQKPVHVFDSFNLSIILQELDTICDFRWYISEKEEAIERYSFLAYCGEEDLLTHYFRNFDEEQNRHYIGSLDQSIDSIFIEEGLWNDFRNHKQYIAKKAADKASYLWDELIQRTTQNALEGTLLGNADIFNGKNAIIEMAKEPRFHRRFISDKMISSMKSFPEPKNNMIRQVTFVPSFFKNKAYVLLQLYTPPAFFKSFNEVREFRQNILSIACGVLKNKLPVFEHIIGIALYPPMYEDRVESNPEDFVYLDCVNWNDECINYYTDQNKLLHFFETENLKVYQGNSIEFPEI